MKMYKVNVGLKFGNKITRLTIIIFFSSPAWAALWLPLCHYPSHLFLKIALELVIISAHDRKNIKITHPADSHWITRLSKPAVRSRTKRSRGFVFHLTRMDHPGWSRRLWTVQTFLISGGLPAEKSTSTLAACQELPFRDENTIYTLFHTLHTLSLFHGAVKDLLEHLKHSGSNKKWHRLPPNWHVITLFQKEL